MSITRKVVAGALLAGCTLAGEAQAQVFNYFTTGQFTSAFPTCDNAAAAFVVSCSGGGLSLTFTGTALNPGGYTNVGGTPTTVQLGTFDPAGAGAVTVPPSSVQFTLFIHQTVPTVGTNDAVGYISGFFSQGVGPASSTLIWRPNEIVNIPPSVYDLVFDDDPPANGTGILIAAVNPTTVKAQVLTAAVPEPSTWGLMATGLVGLVGVARRRRQG